MSATIRISAKHARAMLDAWGRLPQQDAGVRAAIDALRAALKPSPKKAASRRSSRLKRESRAKTKREETAAVREAVMKRADGMCEICGWTRIEIEPTQISSPWRIHDGPFRSGAPNPCACPDSEGRKHVLFSC
jgi:hypothetical protein